MVFFRINEVGLPDFVNGHLRDQARCLSQFFDVTVISHDANYAEVVDRLQPDLALFESGVYARRSRRITNTHRHPDIPKLGFLNADGYCPTRSVFLADMDDWGVETFFAIAVSATGYTPDIADRTFVWPNFADKAMFRSYPGGKVEAFLLSGSRESNYPWRVKVDRLLQERYSVRRVPHGGWFDRKSTAGMPTGEEYARSLSAAQIVPVCGTIAEDVVRKHFEVPATGAVLLTERTAAVEAAGFVDMENCVFANEHTVIEKVDSLLNDSEALERIARAGQALAHERHSIENRNQVHQWFELNRVRTNSARIVQPDPFGPLRLAPPLSAGRAVGFVAPAGADRRLIAQGRRQLEMGYPSRAADKFARALNYHFEPEAGLGLARSWIRLGRADWAQAAMEHSTALLMRGHGASHPDPVEWALLVRAVVCVDGPERAFELAGRFASLRHPELDRIRIVVGSLVGHLLPLSDRARHRSVHEEFRVVPWESWKHDLVTDLRSAGRDYDAHRVSAIADPAAREVLPLTKLGTNRHSALDSRPLAHRVLNRIAHKWGRLRGADPTPDRSSIYQLLGGRELATVVLLLTPESVANRIEGMVARDPSPLSVVRLGHLPPVARERFAPWGLRWGVDPALIAEIPRWGRSFLITGREGLGLLEPKAMSAVDMLAVAVGTDIAGLRPPSSEGWRVANADMTAGIAAALAQPGTRVWERAPGFAHSTENRSHP